MVPPAISGSFLPPPPGADKPRQLTFSPPADKRGEHNAQWAPDNSAIFFLAKRGDHTQLFRLDLRGGEASPYDFKILPPVDVSKDKDAINPPPAPESSEKKDDKKPSNAKQEPQTIDVAGFSISFDGKYLALWAHDPETPGEKKQKEAKIDASWVNHEKHLTRIYLAAFKPDGTIEGSLNEVNLPPDVRGATWSPVADKLLVIIEPPNDASDLGPAGAAWIVDAAAPAKPTKLALSPTSVGGGAWNADGTSIVFAAADSSGRASRLRRSLSSGCNARCKADQSHPRIRRPAPCARNILHARRLLHCASGCRHAQRRRPHRSRRQSAAHSHRPRGRSHLRPQHQSQADRLGLARRLRWPPHAALLCLQTRRSLHPASHS